MLFHSIRAAARLARPAAPVGAASAPWLPFSGNMRMFSAFQEEWRKLRGFVRSPPSDEVECDLFRERALDPVSARRLAGFISMGQIWDFMEVVYGKPGQVLTRNERAIRDHQTVPKGDREAAKRPRGGAGT